MKKLVKTARQQFEEDLNNLTLVRTWKMCDSEIYHHCVNGAGHFILFREQDEEYKILMYHKTYEELVLSEEFLFSVTQRFIDGRAEIKQLYNWYASADHEDEPFNLLDVFMSDLEAVNNTYEDEYEEVPDVRIITAEQQFETRLKEAGLIQLWEDQFSVGRIGIEDKESKKLLVFVHEATGDGYTEFIYPPFEELRKDEMFKLKCLDEFCIGDSPEFEAKLSKWLIIGGECPLDPVDVYFPASHLCLEETVDFEDKELPQEQSIEEMIILTPEQKDAVQAFEKAARALKSAGVKIVSYYDENEFYAINGNAKLEFENIFDIDRDGFPNFKSISNTLMENHGINFTWDLYWGLDYDFCAKKL